MDEVDKIIIHSLREIGCLIDEDITGIGNFTPELVVSAAAACIHQIKPTEALPKTLPAGMAQRFAVATTLAKECAECGYRSDIGYQSFLYPNTVDVRRLFMFLIEQLPKENQNLLADLTDNGSPIGAYELLQREIKDKIQKQLRSAWVPQYCRSTGNWRQLGCSSLHVSFQPQLNLNIPEDTNTLEKEVKLYLQQQAPSIFQQHLGKRYDLVSTVLHKNAIDLHAGACETLKEPNLKYSFYTNNAIIQQTVKNRNSIPNEKQQDSLTPTKEIDLRKNSNQYERLNEEIMNLKCQNDELIALRKSQDKELILLNQQHIDIEKTMERISSDNKIHERTCVVLENPKENVEKLERLVQTTQQRRETLEQQWRTYRQPLEQTLQSLQTSKQTRNAQNVSDLREIIDQLELSLRERTAKHVQLVKKLANAEISAAPRKEYTRRILEFIGNIRKQRNDIFKVLDDTRDLQKQLNSVTAQLERQFNYTDDLLFQSAKHDMHAKKAYKLLASLHTTCNDLVELVSQTGNVAKEIRDLEVQIDRERIKNIAISLAQISSDIQNFQNVIKSVQAEIQKIEVQSN